MKKLWAAEPVMVVAFFQALLALAISFGANLTTEQQGMIIATVSALLAMLARSQVSPSPQKAPPAPPEDEAES